jgi:hypothetical protein
MGKSSNTSVDLESVTDYAANLTEVWAEFFDMMDDVIPPSDRVSFRRTVMKIVKLERMEAATQVTGMVSKSLDTTLDLLKSAKEES